MKKSKYELLLSDDIIQRVDYIAKRMVTSRSATVNRLLGERLELPTPEGRLEPLFEEMSAYFCRSESPLYPFRIPASDSVILINKDHHGIQYEVILDKTAPGVIKGELRAFCRTDALVVRQRSGSFSSIIRVIESKYLPWQVRYGNGEGVFVRYFTMTPDQPVEKLTYYVGMIDKLFKGYLAGVYTDKDLEQEYLEYMHDGYAGI